MESTATSAHPVPDRPPKQPRPPGRPGLPDREFLALEHEILLLATELATLGDFPRTARVAVERLRALLDARSVTLVAFDHRAQAPVLAASTLPGIGGSATAGLAAITAFLVVRRRARRAHRAADLATRSPELAACLEALEADWLVPLVRREELMGLLVVGAKEQGGSCSREELELLHLLSFQLALLLESAELLEVATFDGLTGALRRRPVLCLLERELERLHRYGRPLAVLMVDLDRFKWVNDRHGHLVGDALLRAVSQALSERLRATDLLGRYGGDEILVVLPETGAEAARSVAEELRRAVVRTLVAGAGGEPASVTASIGMTVVERDASGRGVASRDLLTVADAALYQAKRDGRDRTVLMTPPARLVTGPAMRRPAREAAE